MAEKPKKPEEREYRVEVIGRHVMSIYPRLGEEHIHVISVYREEKLPTGSVTIDLYELFGDKQHEAAEQIRKRKGPLFDEFKREEAKLIKADRESRLAERPEVITV